MKRDTIDSAVAFEIAVRGLGCRLASQNQNPTVLTPKGTHVAFVPGMFDVDYDATFAEVQEQIEHENKGESP